MIFTKKYDGYDVYPHSPGKVRLACWLLDERGETTYKVVKADMILDERAVSEIYWASKPYWIRWLFQK